MDNPAGPESPTDTSGRSVPKPKRFQQAQAQVDEVVDIMRKNIDKVLERDTKLSQLDDRADALQEGASQFEKSTGTLKNKMAWKNMKVAIALAVCAVVLLAVVFVYFGRKHKGEAAAAGGGEAEAAESTHHSTGPMGHNVQPTDAGHVGAQQAHGAADAGGGHGPPPPVGGRQPTGAQHAQPAMGQQQHAKHQPAH